MLIYTHIYVSHINRDVYRDKCKKTVVHNLLASGFAQHYRCADVYGGIRYKRIKRLSLIDTINRGIYRPYKGFKSLLSNIYLSDILITIIVKEEFYKKYHLTGKSTRYMSGLFILIISPET